MDFAKQYGPMAVISGGSEGVGAAYAMQLAERGLDIALVARKPGPLEETAARIRAACPDREVLTRSVDLSFADAADRILDLTGDREVGLLIHNAGASNRTSNFVDSDLQFAHDLLAVNVGTMMTLVHRYGGQMKVRGRGGVILLSSFAYLVGNPGLAAYSGSKAFSTMFAEALWHELKPSGVHVLAQVLGMTDTPANARNFPGMAGVGDRPEDIASQGLAALPDGPVLYAAGGGDLARMLGGMDRGQAVNQMYDMGAAFRD